MYRQIVIAVCALVALSAADTKFPDGTYVHHFQPNAVSVKNYPPHQPVLPNGYGVQTGYEGYLIPTKTAEGSGLNWRHGLLAAVLPIAKLILTFPFTSGLWIAGTLTLLLGGALLCHFTPVCGFSLLGLGRTYLNEDSLNSATAFVMDAIEKHSGLQKKPVSAKESKETKENKEIKESKDSKENKGVKETKDI